MVYIRISFLFNIQCNENKLMDSDQILDIALILTGPRPLFGIRISFLLNIIFLSCKIHQYYLEKYEFGIYYSQLIMGYSLCLGGRGEGVGCVLSKLC